MKTTNAMTRMTDSLKMVAEQAIEIAAKYQDQGSMASSAKVALEDARSCLADGRYKYAVDRARDSVAYSVGKWSQPWNTINAMAW